MSVKLQGRLDKLGLSLPRAQAHVLDAMCWFADDDGTNCYPSVPTIAEKARYSLRTVQDAMKVLEEAGYIIAVGNPRGGRSNATMYRIEIDHPVSIKGAKTARLVKPKDEPTPPTDDIKGAEIAPFINDVKGVIAAPFESEKGAIVAQRVQSSPVKGVILADKGCNSLHAYKTDPRADSSFDPSEDSSEEKNPPSLGNEAPEGASPPGDAADAVMDGIVAKGSAKKFIPPTEDETIEFFKSIKGTEVDAKKFWLHFASNGWKVSGRAKMVDWQASARGWMLRSPEFVGSGRSPTSAESVVNAGEEKARKEFRIEEKRIVAEQKAAKEAAEAALDAEIAALPPDLRERLYQAARRRLKKRSAVIWTDDRLDKKAETTNSAVKLAEREIYLEKKANVKPGQDQNGDRDPASGC